MGVKCLVLVFALLRLQGCHDGNDGGSRESSPRSPTPEPGQYLKTDAEILDNLKRNLGLIAVDKGGAGRCLFHSLREQITQAELAAIKGGLELALQAEIDNYNTLTNDGQADLLRAIAIAYEKDFLVTKNNKSKAFTVLNYQDQAWTLEMAKDYHEELEHSRDKTRAWFYANKGSAAGRQTMWQYVVSNRDAYWAKTSCATNWAGTAEAIVFARLLKRPLRMYGMDLVSSSDGAKLDEHGVVKPYLEYNYSYPNQPLLVYQTGGGGHYQMLKKN